ncbi:putative phenylalanine ammonia-lyase [Cenococcum geophilum 1.58]|uniref:putative phenylalanine ammonia-lyase n=1 Tax=Cenococcum geophilum 1.58 TaxID=794803 RepID=UPI00358EF11A|nr:putative phenylalanine ammonia-lyase [Cenococcum geophilum 1.58]
MTQDDSLLSGFPTNACGHQRSHGSLVVAEWDKLHKQLENKTTVLVDGSSLDMASITAVARYGISGALSHHPVTVNRVNASVEFLDEYLAQGHTVYGINTGFGGSADVRTNDTHLLQRSLLQMQQSGILPVSKEQGLNRESESIYGAALHSDPFASLSMPEAWVRATMLVRWNSLARGHSAVRPCIIEYLMKLLKHDLIPLVPLRGSISASGDLSPLSYLAGALEGNPDVYVWTGDRNKSGNPRRPIPASDALKMLKLKPITFGPKEVLALVNGTAVSASVASLALHELHNLVSLSQVLTAMGVEAILGTAESFSPFISSVRPHPGQKEVACTILSLLSGSQLASGVAGSPTAAAHGLFQDRYSIRTVPQWLGPFVEDLLLAHDQLVTECNSTTDNPLINAAAREVYHGGNFQAVSATTAMEKSRLAAQAVGRMLFAQCTELLNPATNRGLSPSLCADEPSLSFTLKGVDINMAAYMSELSFLANPVHSHVQNAEMGNQALNSLALVSARYTHTAVDLLSLMSASYLYTLCQALDLRAMHIYFTRELQPALARLVEDVFGVMAGGKTRMALLKEAVWTYVTHEMMKTSTLDSAQRFEKIMSGAQTAVLSFFQPPTPAPAPMPQCNGSMNGFVNGSNHAKVGVKSSTEYPADLSFALHTFRDRAASTSLALFSQTRERYLADPDAMPFLGAASRRMYAFVRKELQVPMNRGLVDHPTPVPSAAVNGSSNGVSKEDRRVKKTTGNWISVVYDALRQGQVTEVVVECLRKGRERPAAAKTHAE